MSNDTERWFKLAAMVNDKSTTVAEKATARQMLCALDAKMGGIRNKQLTFTVETTQSWALALGKAVGQTLGLKTAITPNGFTWEGKSVAILKAKESYSFAQDALEEVVLLAAAGWIAQKFPSLSGEKSELELSVAELGLLSAVADPDFNPKSENKLRRKQIATRFRLDSKK